MSKPLRVLVVDDSENDALLLLRGLRHGGFEPVFERVDTPNAMAAALTDHVWDIIISDYSMPYFSGLAALQVLKHSGLDLPFILVSGAIGEDLAVAAMKAGAHDYVMKKNLERLPSAIERELREAEIRREHKQAEEKLRYLAQYDPLTDLPNRNLFYERLDHALVSGRREGKPLALMTIDLDDFGEINGTIGHQNGDLLLQQIGRRLKRMLREYDTVARLDGDEFGVLLPGTDKKGATLVARELLNALELPFQIGELTMDARASIGIAFFPTHANDKDTLMRCTDSAVSIAKQSNSGYAIYSPDRDSYSPERFALMAELRRAIDNNQLFLAYQPKIDLGTARVIGVEALARWWHPQVGLIPPDQFIGMAERSGFIRSLTMWVLNEALRVCRSWRRQGFEIPVSVNLSARTLHEVNLPVRIFELLKRHGIAPDQLELEISESFIMGDPAHTLEVLKRLHQMGVGLFIDDFGMGYSLLGYLKKLPVNAVKIDKSFVIGMTTNENDALIVRSTIDLAHNLGLKVVAEGVENRDVWNRLVALGCDAAQGYYISRPFPSRDMTKWLSESPWGLGRSTLKLARHEIMQLKNGL